MDNRISILGLALVMLLAFTEGCVEHNVIDFNSCIAAGYPVMESYPRQCKTPDGISFVENITINKTNDINQEKCESAGGNWNECSNKCQIDNQNIVGAACTLQCEALCECSGIAGFKCPDGFECTKPSGVADALGYCVAQLNQ